jgi:hypothetical protein
MLTANRSHPGPLRHHRTSSPWPFDRARSASIAYQAGRHGGQPRWRMTREPAAAAPGLIGWLPSGCGVCSTAEARRAIGGCRRQAGRPRAFPGRSTPTMGDLAGSRSRRKFRRLEPACSCWWHHHGRNRITLADAKTRSLLQQSVRVDFRNSRTVRKQ